METTSVRPSVCDLVRTSKSSVVFSWNSILGVLDKKCEVFRENRLNGSRNFGNHVVWDVTTCRWASYFRRFEGTWSFIVKCYSCWTAWILKPEDAATIVQNCGDQSTSDTLSRHGKPESSGTPSWQRPISPSCFTYWCQWIPYFLTDFDEIRRRIFPCTDVEFRKNRHS